MANPRAESLALVVKLTAAGHDPAAVEQLMRDLSACSDTAFAEVCGLTSKLAAARDPKVAAQAASVEVDKQPRKAVAAQGK